MKAFLHTLNFTVSQIQSEKLIFQLHQGKTWRSYDWAEYKGKHYALVAVSIDWCKIVMLWFFWLYKFKLWQLDLPVVHLCPRVGRPSHGWEQIPTQAWNWSQIIMTNGHWPMTNDHEGYYHDYCVHHPGQKANMAKTSTAAGRHDLKLSQAASQWRIGT